MTLPSAGPYGPYTYLQTPVTTPSPIHRVSPSCIPTPGVTSPRYTPLPPGTISPQPHQDSQITNDDPANQYPPKDDQVSDLAARFEKKTKAGNHIHPLRRANIRPSTSTIPSRSNQPPKLTHSTATMIGLRLGRIQSGPQRLHDNTPQAKERHPA